MIASDSWPTPLRPEAFHGIAGQFVRAVAHETEADPVALLVSFLAAAGSAIGAAPHVEVSGDRHPAKLWAVLVGDTAGGRKGTSLAWVREVVEKADPSWATRHASNLASGEVVAWAVRDATTATGRDGEEVVTEAGEDDKRLFAIESEFASVLRVAKRDGSVLSPILRQAWDSDRIIHTAKRNPARCMRGAHVVVLGHVTADELRRELSAADVANGFANRFMFVSVRRARSLPRGGRLPPGALDAIAEPLAVFLDYARTRCRIEAGPTFWEVYEPWYERTQDAVPGVVGSVLGRSAPYVLRLSLLFALLDGEDVLRADHARAALAVWQYVSDSAWHVFGRLSGDPVRDRIIAALAESPGGMTRTGLRDLFHRHASAKDIDAALMALLGVGEATYEPLRTGGRPVTLWRATKATEATKASSVASVAAASRPVELGDA